MQRANELAKKYGERFAPPRVTGETLDSIATRSFSGIMRAQAYECLAYYEDHRGDIDVLVARQMLPETR